MLTERRIRPVHEVVLQLLQGNRPDDVPALAALYAEGAVCPQEAIDKLVEAFLDAVRIPEIFDGDEHEIVQEAIRRLISQKRAITPGSTSS